MDKTRSEEVFEEFLCKHGIAFESIPVSTERTPDYWVHFETFTAAFEIKEITKDEKFKGIGAVSGRTIGNHVRDRINDSKAQIQYAANKGLPAVLMIYNALDPLQFFGTEDLDFQAAMYGELTILVSAETGRQTSDMFHGNNKFLQESKNTSFSALGSLRDFNKSPTITLYENVHSKYPLPYEALPDCFKIIRYEI